MANATECHSAMPPECDNVLEMPRSVAIAVVVGFTLSVLLLCHSASIAVPLIMRAANAQAQTRQLQNEVRAIQTSMQNDPPLGAHMALTDLCDESGRSFSIPSTPKEKLVVFVAGPRKTTCSACRTGDFIEAAESLVRSCGSLEGYVVWAGQADLLGLRGTRKPYRAVSFLVDPQLEVCHRMNVSFFPRVYLVSAQGKLLYVMPYMESATAVVSAVEEIARDSQCSQS